MATYKITTPGGDFEINVPGGWATEDTLESIARKLQARKDTFSQTADNFNKATDPNKRGSMGASAKSAGKALDEFEEELTATQKALSGLELAVGSVGDIASGLLQSTGKLTDVNPIVDSVTGRLSKFFQTFGGIEVLGVSVGGAASAATELARDLINLSNVVGQRVIDVFDGLTQAGVGTSYNFTDLGETLADLKISSETLTKVVRESSMALLQLGDLGDLESGLNKFQNTLAILTGDGDDGLRRDFRALGMSTNETAEFFGEFIENNRRGLMLRNMTEAQLASASLAYGKNLQVLAELTGKDIDQVRQEIATAQIAQGARLMMARLDREAADGMGGFTMSLETIASQVPKAFEPVVSQLTKFDAAVGEQAVFNMMYPEAIAQLNADIDRMNTTVMTTEQRQAEAADAVARFNSAIGQGAGGAGSRIAELAGIVPDATGVLSTLADGALDAEEQTRRFGDAVGEDLLDEFRIQQSALIETIKGANTVLGSYVDAVINIEDVRSEFESMLFMNTQGTFDFIIKQTGKFYGMLADTLGLGQIAEVDTRTPEQIERDNRQEEIRRKNNEDAISLIRSVLGPEGERVLDNITSNQFGGPLAPNTVSMVGEAGRELITMGNTGGEVINNATTEKIMGAANAVVNNMGNDASGVLKQISDILNQSNTIQSNILKETRRSKGFQY